MIPRWLAALGATVIVLVGAVTITSLTGDDGDAEAPTTPTPTAATPTAPSPDPPSASPDPTTPSPDPTTPSPDPTTPSPDPTTASPDPTTPSPDPTAAPARPPGVGPAADLVFADEFDHDELDRAAWNTCHWWAPGGCTIASNDELEWYVPDAVSVSDGSLWLEAREDPQRTDEGEELPYASGMVTTGKTTDDTPDSKFSFTYGYAEIRARIPRGTGLWPAFWLLPETLSSKPEIDVLEVYGDSTDILRMRLHWEGDNIGERHTGTDLADGWHTYAVDWEPGRITWYLDDEPVWTLEHDEVPREPMYLILNLAVGGAGPGDPSDATEFPARFEIDYVRVYQEPVG